MASQKGFEPPASADALRHLLTLPSKPEMTLIFFAGTVIGTMTKNMKEVINGRSFPLDFRGNGTDVISGALGVKVTWI